LDDDSVVSSLRPFIDTARSLLVAFGRSPAKNSRSLTFEFLAAIHPNCRRLGSLAGETRNKRPTTHPKGCVVLLGSALHLFLSILATPRPLAQPPLHCGTYNTLSAGYSGRVLQQVG
jgi:hypothetical protein